MAKPTQLKRGRPRRAQRKTMAPRIPHHSPIIDRRAGGTGYVEIRNDGTVRKYINTNEFYWAREYIVSRYLAKLQHGGHAHCDSRLEFKKVDKRFCAMISMPNYGRPITPAMITTDASFLQLFVDVIRAIRVAHSAGVIHRDVKPENILVGDGHATLIDFGHSHICKANFAKLTDAVYTYMYRPPEVYKGDQYSFAADIWACGATFAALILGRSIYAEMTGAPCSEATIKQYLCAAGGKQQEDFAVVFARAANDRHAACHAIQHATTLTRETIDQCFIWLHAMLTMDPKKRPTADQIEWAAIKYAESIGVQIETRSFFTEAEEYIDHDDYDKHNLRVYDAANNCQIALQASNEAAYAIDQLKLPVDLLACGAIIDHLVERGTITMDNCRVTIVATALLVANVIYDYNCSLSEAIRMIPGVQRAALIGAMSHVLSVHMRDVFLERNFSY